MNEFAQPSISDCSDGDFVVDLSFINSSMVNLATGGGGVLMVCFVGRPPLAYCVRLDRSCFLKCHSDSATLMELATRS